MSYALADVVTLEVILEDMDDMGMGMKNAHRTLAMELVIKHIKEIIEEVQGRITEDFKQTI